MIAIRNTFKVYERLKKEQHINTLFLSGKAFSVFPLRLVYTVNPRPEGKASPALAGFSVPKKKFRHSVDRHRIRRLMVEAWRLNKHALYSAIPADKQLHVFCVFVDKTMPEYDAVKTAMVPALSKLAETVNTPGQPPAP